MSETRTEKTGLEAWMQHRVSYGETDCMGVLYHAEYLHIFERGRSAFIRNFGISYKDVEARNLYLPVREAKCRYRSPARYDDLLNLITIAADWGRASLVFHYRLYNEGRTMLLADGLTQHAFIDGTGKPVAVPDWFREYFT
jgi:acyl-CoA thioester hydrolase